MFFFTLFYIIFPLIELKLIVYTFLPSCYLLHLILSQECYVYDQLFDQVHLVDHHHHHVLFNNLSASDQILHRTNTVNLYIPSWFVPPIHLFQIQYPEFPLLGWNGPMQLLLLVAVQPPFQLLSRRGLAR